MYVCMYVCMYIYLYIASEFLDFHLKPGMRKGASYIKNTNDILEKLSQIGEIPEGSILVTADVVDLYPSIPHHDGLLYLKDRLDKRTDKRVPTSALIEMAGFVLKNNFFEFDGVVKHQIYITAIGTKFAPPHICIFMDKVETDVLATEEEKP